MTHRPPRNPLNCFNKHLDFEDIRTIGDGITVRSQEIAKHNQYSRLQQNLQKKRFFFEAMVFLKKKTVSFLKKQRPKTTFISLLTQHGRSPKNFCHLAYQIAFSLIKKNAATRNCSILIKSSLIVRTNHGSMQKLKPCFDTS